MSAVQYLGHGTNTGGLQAHSIGGEYPYIIEGFQRSLDGPLLWRVLDSRNGKVYAGRASYKAAAQDVAAAQCADAVAAFLAAKTPAFAAGWRNWYSGGTEQGNPFGERASILAAEWLEGYRAARADARRQLN